MTRAEVVRLHGEGWKDDAIAAHLGLCRSAVTYHRRVLGLPSNCRSLAAERKVAIIAMKAVGMSERSMSRLLGVDRSSVRYHLERQ
jgi:DNA-binding NarL/FixJ family response regulator